MVYSLLALGSNIGNKAENIEKAYVELQENNIEIIKKSSIIDSKPYGVKEQDDFKNSVVLVKTFYYPEELLKILKKIEKKIGRYGTFRWGPRVIDIDIILYDRICYTSEELNIPHIDYKNRDFVLKPMEEIKELLTSYLL